MQRDISMRTQNIFVSIIDVASFVDHKEVNYAASKNSSSSGGNWLSSGNSHAMSIIDSNNQALWNELDWPLNSH